MLATHLPFTCVVTLLSCCQAGDAAADAADAAGRSGGGSRGRAAASRLPLRARLSDWFQRQQQALLRPARGGRGGEGGSEFAVSRATELLPPLLPPSLCEALAVRLAEFLSGPTRRPTGAGARATSDASSALSPFGEYLRACASPGSAVQLAGGEMDGGGDGRLEGAASPPAERQALWGALLPLVRGPGALGPMLALRGVPPLPELARVPFPLFGLRSFPALRDALANSRRAAAAATAAAGASPALEPPEPSMSSLLLLARHTI
jgi:hypothetical protein